MEAKQLWCEAYLHGLTLSTTESPNAEALAVANQAVKDYEAAYPDTPVPAPLDASVALTGEPSPLETPVETPPMQSETGLM